jgi:hypothetical protein
MCSAVLARSLLEYLLVIAFVMPYSVFRLDHTSKKSLQGFPLTCVALLTHRVKLRPRNMAKHTGLACFCLINPDAFNRGSFAFATVE